MLGLGISSNAYISGGPPWSLKLDGSLDHGRAEHNASIKPTTGMTLSVWVNLDEVHGGAGWTFVNSGGNEDHQQTIIGCETLTGGWSINVFYGGTEANPIVRLRAKLMVTDAGGGGAAPQGFLEHVWGGIVSSTDEQPLHEIKDFSGWNHIALTYDGGVSRLYINGNNDLGEGAVDTSSNQTIDSGVTGKSVQYQSNTKVFVGADAIGIGDNSEDNLLGGLIDDFAIWRTALSSSEISTIYNNRKVGVDLSTVQESSLGAWWKFEEGTGSTVADSSSNNNVLTLVNSPSWSDNTSE
jgi:hypothetical protein